jgi:small subunit ribosomal protein S8
MMTDPIADTLTRLRNAMMAGHSDLVMPHSKTREGVLNRLFEQGYLKSVKTIADASRKTLAVELKYTADKKPVVTGISRVSRPGYRVYKGYKEIQPVFSGLGMLILSTPQGILTDRQARDKKVGGEVLCKVW